MKKILLTLFFMVMGITIFGQSRLGSTVSDIKSEFWEKKYDRKSGYTDNNQYYITIKTERANVIYYFDSNNVCNLTAIIPDNQGALNFYVQLYNERYVIVSSTKWKMYSNNGIADIELIYPEDGGYYFIWH